MTDYRCGKRDTIFNNIKQKKLAFISTNSITGTNHYRILSDRSKPYKYKFISEVFNEKCAYCGISLSVERIDLFEIDHFVAKSLDTQIDVNNIQNLVPACQLCNRKKRDFDFSSPEIFDVEKGLNNLFYRDDNFYIKICDQYNNNQEVLNFYKKMVYDQEIRRLDYILISMDGLIKNTNGEKQDILRGIMNLLTEKRNKISSFIK